MSQHYSDTISSPSRPTEYCRPDSLDDPSWLPQHHETFSILVSRQGERLPDICTPSQGAPRSFRAGGRHGFCHAPVTARGHRESPPPSTSFAVVQLLSVSGYWHRTYVPETFLSLFLLAVVASWSSRKPTADTFLSLAWQSLCSNMQLPFILLPLSFLLFLLPICYQCDATRPQI